MQRIAIGRLMSKAKVRRSGSDEYPVLSITMKDGIVLQGDKFKKRIASQDTADYKVVPCGKLVQGIHIDEGNFGIQDLVPEGIVSPAYTIWDVNEELVIPQYLETALRSPQCIAYYKSKLTGTVNRRGHMSDKDFLGMEIPYLSKDGQQKALNILDQAKQIVITRQQQLQQLDELVKARFVEMFGTYPANQHGWETGTIREAVTEVRYGSSRKAAEGNTGKYPYLRMNNITYGGELDLSDTKTIDIPDDELPKCSVRRGDVLFNRTNSRDLVGKTCVYNRDELMVLAGFVVRVRVNKKILPEFLSAFMNTDFTKAMLFAMCKAAIGQANINAQEFQNIGIYFPPVELQRQFVAFKEQVDKSKVVGMNHPLATAA